MKALTTAAATLLIVLTAACGNTADGVRRDADNAAEKTADAATDAGAAVGGAIETGQVKTALMADTRIDASDINVDTNEDARTVTLKGTVKTELERVTAGEIAAGKAAGYTIVNELTVRS